MKAQIKILLKKIISPEKRVLIKKKLRHLKSFFKSDSKKKTTIKELGKILKEGLGIKKGDNIIVASSFGYLNASYTPQEVIELLQSIVTPEGSIMMPYYPPTNSDVWAKRNEVFDMNTTKSGMGILTNVFSKMPNVYKSIHPTKAVCVWGKNAKEIIQGHENATTPFYWDSPYGKYMLQGSKSVGLGLKNIPIFHTCEDVLSESPNAYYYPEKFTLDIITTEQEKISVKTYIHNSELLCRCTSAGNYVRNLQCSTYKRLKFGMSFVYVIDNTDLNERVKIEFAKGNSRIRK